MDAISNLIYWKGDSNRGINEGGIEFLKNMNQHLQENHKRYYVDCRGFNRLS